MNCTHKTACKVRVHISTEDEWPFVIIDGIHNHSDEQNRTERTSCEQASSTGMVLSTVARKREVWAPSLEPSLSSMP